LAEIERRISAEGLNMKSNTSNLNKSLVEHNSRKIMLKRNYRYG
jgi:hypothetical protein